MMTIMMTMRMMILRFCLQVIFQLDRWDRIWVLARGCVWVKVSAPSTILSMFLLTRCYSMADVIALLFSAGFDIPFVSLFLSMHIPYAEVLTYFLPWDKATATRKSPRNCKLSQSYKRKWLPAVSGPGNHKPGSLSVLSALCICADSSLLFPFVSGACFFKSSLVFSGVKGAYWWGGGSGGRSWLVNCEETSGPPVV